MEGKYAIQKIATEVCPKGAWTRSESKVKDSPEGSNLFAIWFKKPWYMDNMYTDTHTHAHDSMSYILFTSLSLCKYMSRVHWNEQF